MLETSFPDVTVAIPLYCVAKELSFMATDEIEFVSLLITVVFTVKSLVPEDVMEVVIWRFAG